MLLAAWRGELAAMKAMVERAAELAKREPKHVRFLLHAGHRLLRLGRAEESPCQSTIDGR